MNGGIGSVAVLTNDAGKLAEWYRDKLEFEIVGVRGHAVFVKPKGPGTPLIHLCGKCDAWGEDRPGGRTGIWLSCGEIAINKNSETGTVLPASDPAEVERTYWELKEKGVEFSVELTKTSWGKYAVLRDPDGNEFEIS